LVSKEIDKIIYPELSGRTTGIVSNTNLFMGMNGFVPLGLFRPGWISCPKLAKSDETKI
jgi:hypothetical protein